MRPIQAAAPDNPRPPSAMTPRPIDRAKMCLALLSGVLMAGAFPRPGLFPLAWAALVPLWVALRDVRPGDAFRLGLAAGTLHCLLVIYWIATTMVTYGGLPYAVAAGVLLLFSLYLGLYWGVFAALLVRFGRRPAVALALAPALWAGLEYLRAVLLTGFPWGFLGHSQEPFGAVIQMVDITGVYGLSFLIVLANGALALQLLGAGGKTWQGQAPSPRLRRGSLALAAALTAAAVGYGAWRSHQLAPVIAAAPTLRTALVQGNIPQGLKWDPAFQIGSTKKYIDLSQGLKGQAPDLVVWPETATPFYLHHNAALTRLVLGGIQATGCHFLIGSPSLDGPPGQERYYNSAYLLDPAGQVAGRYDKAHLVPFGEYVPLRRWLPFLGKIVAQVGDFAAGAPGALIPWERAALGPLICYEAIFPELARAQVRQGAALLVNLTNDAWYGRTSAPHQHFDLAVFRAVENRRSLVRAANTGISGVVDPLGRVTARTGLFVDAALVQGVPLVGDRITVYTRLGDWFPLACLLAAALVAARLRRDPP